MYIHACYNKLCEIEPRSASGTIEHTVYITKSVILHSKKSLSYFKKKKTYFERNILKIRENFLGEW